MPQMRPDATGIPWYEVDDYLQIRRIMADGDRLPLLYSHWLKRAEEAERRIVASGVRAIRVPIDPEQFRIWCKIRILRCDSAARGRFIHEKVRDLVMSDQVRGKPAI
ncbi:MAG: hypothetical protein WA268_15450 [Xanthobacteraceae bacterium]